MILELRYGQGFIVLDVEERTETVDAADCTEPYEHLAVVCRLEGRVIAGLPKDVRPGHYLHVASGGFQADLLVLDGHGAFRSDSRYEAPEGLFG